MKMTDVSIRFEICDNKRFIIQKSIKNIFFLKTYKIQDHVKISVKVKLVSLKTIPAVVHV